MALSKCVINRVIFFLEEVPTSTEESGLVIGVCGQIEARPFFYKQLPAVDGWLLVDSGVRLVFSVRPFYFCKTIV